MRKPRIKKEEVFEPAAESVVEFGTPEETVTKKPMDFKTAAGIGVIGLIAVVVFFWYKTNTWPIAAIADGRIITRFTLDKNLYQQGGKTVLDNLVTEQLVRSALDKQNITVDKQAVDQKYNEIIKQVPAGTDVKALLASKGMTEADLRKQVELQLRIEKAVAAKVVVTDAEIDKYVTDNSSYLTGSGSAEKRANAAELLKSQKSQAEIQSWVDEIRKSAKVWTPDNSWSPTSTTTAQ